MPASLEVADIFRTAGPAYRAAHAGHLSLHQLKVMSAIEHCRTAALGGHVEACEKCGHRRIAYNSCRNRHCPKCQGTAARAWLAEREADLLPVGYFHVVFTLPDEVAEIAFHNKAVVYDLLFRAASETMLTIAADPRHLGARIGITAVLHTWGSALTHHPHVHMIVPGGGIALDGERWISSRPAFLLPVRVLGKLFRRLFLTKLLALHDAVRLAFFGGLAPLADRRAFLRHLSPVRQKRWVVYAKPPFAGPKAVLAYLSRYTHRVAISNRRLLAFDDTGVTFRYKDYRRDGAARHQVMTLEPAVHPPLPAACPAQGLSPHSPLRAVRQRRPQGKPRPRPPASGSASTHDPGCHRQRRCSGTMAPVPVLRRVHDHRRGPGADHPAALSAGYDAAAREGSAVIARRLNPAKADIHPSRATIPLAPAAPHVPSAMMNRTHPPKGPAAKRPIWSSRDKKDAPQSIAHAAIRQHPGAPSPPSNHNSP